MNIYFNGFWPGFLEGTAGIHVGFFKNLLQNKQYTIVDNPGEANALVESFFAQSLLNYKKWDLTVFFSGEAYIPEQINRYTISLGPNRCNIICPLAIPCALAHSTFQRLSSVPNKMACGIISNNNSACRNNIINLLAKSISIDMGGKYLNNIGGTISGDYWEQPTLDFYANYKFAFAFENTVTDYYITEKIINVLRAGVIPIYFGAPQIGEFINTSRILIINENNIHQIVQRMLEINNNPQEWMRITNEKIFTEKFSANLNIIKNKFTEKFFASLNIIKNKFYNYEEQFTTTNGANPIA